MKKVINPVLLFIASLILSNCNHSKQGEIQRKIISHDAVSSVDTSFLADKNFVYKNISRTDDIKLIYRTDSPGGGDANLYADSSYKKTYVPLTQNQKGSLIVTFISKELDVNEKYVKDFMQAYFISKQNRIGNLQPIIVYITGDDYGSETILFLNKDNRPVSGFNLEGGMEPGPTEIGDSLISYEKKSYSHISKNRITTYRINQTDHTDSTKREILIDSNVFVSTIDKTGKIITKQTVKAHFRKTQ